MKDNEFRAKYIALFTTLGILLVAVDQLTKLLAQITILGYEGKPIIEGVLELLFVQNTGAAFSFLSGQTWVFLITTPILIAIIVYFFIKIPFTRKFVPLKMCLTFLLAGALGNLIDRIALGAVRDFIYFSIINFPVFNVADIYVTLSLIVLLCLIIFKYKDEDYREIFPKKEPKDD